MRETLIERADEARRELAEFRAGRWEASLLEETPDGRNVLEFRSGDERLIGKVWPDGDGAAMLGLLQALAAATTATFRVPQPVAWCERSRVLVTEVASGAACRGLGPATWAGPLERVGRALREFHGLDLRPTPLRQMSDHVRELMRPGPTTMATAFPTHADRIGRTLAELEAAERSWGPLPVVPLHRDFHLRQLFDDGEHVTVLDWDDAASGDAAFDVGYLTAYLKTHYGDAAAVSGIAAFRTGYGGERALWSRVPVYERFNFLRRACRRLRLQDRGWERELSAMMARLEPA
jgi:aminoglycoside phosphotransferase (APT) family kinase protein